ncbi:MAG: 3'-5' exonuclease [Deltaproteobacteria bacterium]|nr:3'-5' exonuclease [Deltaproteobacteria bacterium]
MSNILKWLGLSKHETLKKNRQKFYDFNRNKSLEDYDFVVFDTELTGLEPRTDEIVSIGAVRVQKLRIALGKNFFCYARPNKPLPKDSTLIHRITPSQIIDAPPLSETLPDFVDFTSGAVIVGHFVNIDMNFLNRATRNFLGGTIKNPVIDTMKMAQFYEDYRKRNYYEDRVSRLSFGLNDLAKKYGLPLFEKHDALEDAMQTAYLFLFLAKRLRNVGISTLRDMIAAQSRAAFSSDRDSYTA